MRNILMSTVSAAALLIGTPALAQSQSTVNQGGTTNGATVTQTSTNQSLSTINQNTGAGNGPGGNNTATVTQSDDEVSGFTPANESTVDQGGDGNTADVLQAQRIGPERNKSTITQSGAGGAGSDAFVRQYGHNDSTIKQTGNGASATVRQGADGQAVGGNVSTVDQDDSDIATVQQNFLIPQNGVGNYGGNNSDVDQAGGGNSATVNQDGLFGISVVDQAGGASATIDQNGNDQDSSIIQSADADATVTQSGLSNESDVIQDGDGDFASVTQSGNDNESSITQERDPGSSLRARATVSQTGNDHNSTIAQVSGGSVTVTQSGVKGSTSTVTTEANPEAVPIDLGLGGNTVQVTQSDAGTGPSAGNANQSTVIQDNVNLGTSAVVSQTHDIAGETENFSSIR